MDLVETDVDRCNDVLKYCPYRYTGMPTCVGIPEKETDVIEYSEVHFSLPLFTFLCFCECGITRTCNPSGA